MFICKGVSFYWTLMSWWGIGGGEGERKGVWLKVNTFFFRWRRAWGIAKGSHIREKEIDIKSLTPSWYQRFMFLVCHLKNGRMPVMRKVTWATLNVPLPFFPQSSSSTILSILLFTLSSGYTWCIVSTSNAVVTYIFFLLWLAYTKTRVSQEASPKKTTGRIKWNWASGVSLCFEGRRVEGPWVGYGPQAYALWITASKHSQSLS